MYNEQIEKLIELALADGELTEKEKQVLFKRAEAEGIDLDEFEMVLEARIFEKTKDKTEKPTATPKSNKFGDVRKCPACGAIVQAFSTQCSDCGYEITNIEANNSVKILSDKLENILIECNNKSFEDKSLFGKLTNTADEIEQRKSTEIKQRQRDIIKNFPIPNTRGDILEFLHYVTPKIKTGFSADKNVMAWRNKYTEVLSRAESAFANDTKMMAEIEKYKQQYKSSRFALPISWYMGLSKKGKVIVAYVFFIVVISVLIGTCRSSH